MVVTDFGRGQYVLRGMGVSVRVSRRAVIVVTILVITAMMLSLYAVGVGTYPIAISDVVSVLLGRNSSFDRIVVLQWRLPRILMALLIGAALGVSGAIFQVLSRNSLGSPDIIGINFGAYTGVLVVITSIGSGYYSLAAGALVGALATACVVFLVSQNSGIGGYRFIVVGIAISAVLNSVNQWIVIKLDYHTAVTASVWQQGTLNMLGWNHVVPMAICFGVVVGYVVMLGPQLQVLQMGDDVAGALGVRLQRARLAYLVAGVVLVALACAAAGPITFVALAAPHIARKLTGGSGVGLWSSAVLGAVLLLFSDIIAQRLFTGNELPVGAVTAVLGGTYLSYLLLAQVRKGVQ